MKKQCIVSLSILVFLFQTKGFAVDRDSLGVKGPGRDSSFSVGKIVDVRKRFEAKTKYRYTTYIENQNSTEQGGDFWIGGMARASYANVGSTLFYTGGGAAQPKLFISREGVNTPLLSFGYYGSSYSIFSIDNGGSVIWNTTGSTDVQLNGTSGVGMVIKPNSNVQIGTTTDAGYKLDVYGTGRFSDVLSVGNVAHADYVGYSLQDINMAVYGNIMAGGLRIGYGAPQGVGVSLAVNGIYKIGAYNNASELRGYTILEQTYDRAGDFLTLTSDGYINRRTAAEVVSDLGLSGASSNSWSTTGNTGSTSSFIGTTTLQPLIFKTNGQEAFRVTEDSKRQVIIGTPTGTTSTDFKLAVGGGIISEKVRVKLQSTGWPDYVFSHGYKLPSLREVEAFIAKNNHLPEVPSAAEVEKDGIDLGNNQAVLLKKLEELTLYVIELNKKVEKLEQENDALKNNKNNSNN